MTICEERPEHATLRPIERARQKSLQGVEQIHRLAKSA